VLAGFGEAAIAGDSPEVKQVMIVEPFHAILQTFFSPPNGIVIPTGA
jgi:hypothetical protein